MVDLPDTLVFATLPSTQRCAGWHYRQAGSVSASTHMMPSSFSSIVLTWLLFISTIIVTSITSTETQRACSLRLAPPMPCILLVIGASLSEPHTNGTSAARVCYIYRTYVVPYIHSYFAFMIQFFNMPSARARDELGGAAPAGQITSRHVNLRHSVYIMYPLCLYSTREVDAARAAALVRLRATFCCYQHGCYKHGCYKMLRIIGGQRGEATA